MLNLRARLAALREESGASRATGPEKAPVTETSVESEPPAGVAKLSAAMKRHLEVRRSAEGGAPAANASSAAASIAALVELTGAAEVAPGLLELDKLYPYPTAYGAHAIDARVATDAGFLLDAAAPARTGDVMLLDTETTGLAGGTGTLPFLTGIAICGREGVRVLQWVLSRFDGEAAMLERLNAYSRDAAMLGSYNGKTFDVPLLQTRASLSRVPLALEPLPHLDLLHPMRRAFAGRWPNCKLQTAERKLLGHARVGDIPGDEIPAVWFDWMRGARPAAMATVIKHNHDDLVGLAALCCRLADVYRSPEDFNARALPVLSHTLCDQSALRERLRAHAARLEPADRLELARFARQAGDWDEAVSIWKQLADQGHQQATEHLAKFHEHRRRDFEQALQLTESLIRAEGAQPRHLHRQQRLLRKRDVEQ